MLSRKPILAILMLVIVSLGAMKALYRSGFYTSHDGWHIVARLYHFDQAVRDGQFPPRWSGELLNGFGYPLFIFTYQLPWWLAETLVLSGINNFDALKLVFILTYVASGLTMYFWINSLWGKTAGFVGAFIYLFTPYRFATILVRANIGEAVSFTFIPLIFWSMSRLDQKHPYVWVVVGALGIAGSLLTHVIVAVLFSLPLVLWLLVSITTKINKKLYLMRVGMMVFLGFGLAAYYLIPAMYYKPLTVFTERYHALYREHFTPLSKLLYSPWGYGALGTAGEMSRQVGVIIWLVVFGVLGAILFISTRKRQFTKNHWLAVVCLVSFGWALFMMIKSSEPLWKIVEPLTLVDFPWRFLAVTTFTGSLLTGYIVTLTRSKMVKAALFLVLIVGALYTNRNHLRVNQYTDIPLSLYVDSELTTNTDDEYLPRWVDRQSARTPAPLINNQLVPLTYVARQSDQISFEYESAEQNKETIHHMYFPGWNMYLDGMWSTLTRNGSGSMSALLPEGKHRVILKFQPTAIMRLGEMMTIGSVVVLLLILSRIINTKRSRIVI